MFEMSPFKLEYKILVTVYSPDVQSIVSSLKKVHTAYQMDEKLKAGDISVPPHITIKVGVETLRNI